ncbi:beta-ketoacyl synthase chain length factor [Amphritea atlantica]|uniref:Beta-ketoacyl synthase chain length factor n=1 Tax=Amphritea atlantica TaxID=355243 RepID=A0ABY5GV72_9GAMM|nr:beta-ketoacyl synthase chain length factor [Amphritea atlantica]
MVGFKLQSWNAFAPGLENHSAWRDWIQCPAELPSGLGKTSLKQIPPMLRRRFTELGRCAAGAALPLLENIDSIPGVFASRHGDTPLTLSLLEGIASDEPMSPTGFSLAVHNALSGLLSIARKDLSEVTAIAATDNLIPNAIIEAVTQLQDSSRVLCVIYDVPLPELYQPYCDSIPFPHAVAMILSREEGEDFILQSEADCIPGADENNDFMRLMRLLTGLDSCARYGSALTRSEWRISRA